jgi:hypothetical protein
MLKVISPGKWILQKSALARDGSILALAARERNLRWSSAARRIPLYSDPPNGLQRAVVSNTQSSDRQFVHSFSVVLGILIVFTILLFAFARSLGKDQNAEQLEDPLVKKATAQNTTPLSHEAIAGQDSNK